jgi:hypothetical protein
MGPAIRWEWRITQGPYRGRVISRITSKQVTANNICHRLLRGVLGGEITPGEKVRVSHCVGLSYLIEVGPNPNKPGQTYVVGVTRATPISVPATVSDGPVTSSPEIQAVHAQLTERANDTRRIGTAGPPTPVAPADGRPELLAEYQVLFPGEAPRRLAGEAINRELLQRGLDPKQVAVIPCAGGGGMKAAADYGLGIPF